MLRGHRPMVCAALFFAACSGRDARRPAVAAEVTCYFGTIGFMIEGITFEGPSVHPWMIRRTVDPAAGRITELSLQPRFPKLVEEDAYAVDGDTATVTRSNLDRTQTVTRTATLVGEPWRWDRWTWTSAPDPDDGGVTERSYTRTATTLNATETSPGTTTEIATEVFDCAEWDARIAAEAR